MELVLPAAPEELINEADFELDERLPYWADLWPSARALARWVLEEPDLPPTAVELGCGVGLPSLALLSREVETLATDYYGDALLFAGENARRNSLPPLRTLLLDWRDPPAELPRFPLVVAADVLYEARNGVALRGLLPGLVAPGGRVIIADPDRSCLPEFLSDAEGDGWRVTPLTERMEEAPAGHGLFTRVRLFELSRQDLL
ncbi:MAG: methyltransferase [Gemmatimonadota bacterium]|nr:methyltransferase [Gemmatimonadota bacterium]